MWQKVTRAEWKFPKDLSIVLTPAPRKIEIPDSVNDDGLSVTIQKGEAKIVLSGAEAAQAFESVFLMLMGHDLLMNQLKGKA